MYLVCDDESELILYMGPLAFPLHFLYIYFFRTPSNALLSLIPLGISHVNCACHEGGGYTPDFLIFSQYRLCMLQSAL